MTSECLFFLSVNIPFYRFIHTAELIAKHNFFSFKKRLKFKWQAGVVRKYRFPSFFVVDEFLHFGRQILKAKMESPFLTRNKAFLTNLC